MFPQLEDVAVIGAFALENARSIVQAMGENMDISISPMAHFAVIPNLTVAIVERITIHDNILS